MKTKFTFEVGDDVAVITENRIVGEDIRRGSVIKILKKYLEVEIPGHGSIYKFALDGSDTYPRHTGYSGWSSIQPWTEDLAWKKKVNSARSYVRRWELPKDLSEENLLKVYALLKSIEGDDTP